MLHQIKFCAFIFRKPSWYKKIIILHTKVHNSLLVRYEVFSSDPRECLCTSRRYTETYENFSIDPAPCRKNPRRKNKTVIKLSAPTTRRKLRWDKSVTAKVCLVWSLLLRKITLKWKCDSRKLSQKCFERKQALKQNI